MTDLSLTQSPVSHATGTAIVTAEESDEREREAPSAGGLGGTESPDGWLAIPWPVADGDERRKLMRDMVLRALI